MFHHARVTGSLHVQIALFYSYQRQCEKDNDASGLDICSIVIKDTVRRITTPLG